MSYGDPRAIFKLFDLSYIDEPIPTSYVAVIGQFESGPMWDGVPVNANDVGKFLETFGNSVAWSQDAVCCIKALEAGANLVVHRVGHCADIRDRSTLDILAASTLIEDRGGTATAGVVQSAPGPFTFLQALSGRGTGTEIGPYVIGAGANDSFKLRLGTAGAWEADQTATLTPGTRTAQQVCDDLNAQTTGINFTVLDGKIHYEAVNAAHDVEILTVANDAYSSLGCNEGVSAATAGTNQLVLAFDGGGDQEFVLAPAHAETGQFALTSAEVAAQMAAISGGGVSGAANRVTLTSGTTGATSSVQVKAASTAAVALGVNTSLHEGTDSETKEPWKIQLIGPGAYGNGAKIYVYDSPLNTGEAVNVRITVPNRPEEYFRELTRDPDSPRNWKNYINAHSRHVRVIDVDDPNAAPNDWPALNATGYTFAGGDDGTLVLTDADWVGDSLAHTGFHCTDHWQMPFIDIFIFGTTSEIVAAEFHLFISGRKGRFGWTPTIQTATAEEAVEWRMGDPAAGYTHAPFNAWESSTIRGKFEVFDAKNNEKVEIPALAYAAAAVCRTDAAHGRHYSPFGVKRGYCPGVLGIDDNPAENAGEADLLAEYQINNARILRTGIENRGWEGAYLWGGWTLQRALSALREVPVARKIKEWEWLLYPIGLSFVNDPNHPVTWREVHRTLDPMLRHDLQDNAIYGYMLVTDRDAFFTAEGELKGAVLQTGRDIDQGQYRCRILIQPVRQIFYFVFEMGVMRTGEPFANYAYMYSMPGWAR